MYSLGMRAWILIIHQPLHALPGVSVVEEQKTDEGQDVQVKAYVVRDLVRESTTLQIWAQVLVPYEPEQVAELEEEENDLHRVRLILKAVRSIVVLGKLPPLSHDVNEHNVDGAHDEKHDQEAVSEKVTLQYMSADKIDSQDGER